MEATKYIRLSGHAAPLPLSAPACERLQRYLAAARAQLVADPDADETVRDLEASLGEQFRVLVDTGGAAVDDDQMARILGETGPVRSQHPVPPTGSRARGPFWCRIDEGKWFGGLCAGIAARGEFRLDWVRTMAILLLFLSGGLIGVGYLAVLPFLPRVATVGEYRELCAAPAR